MDILLRTFSVAVLQAVDTSTIPNSGDWSILVKSLGQFFFYVLIFVFVLALAYYFTRWMASARYMKKGDYNIRVLESVIIGMNTSLQLVKAGKKYFLIAVSKERVSFISEVSEEDLFFAENTAPNNLSFEKYLSTFFNKGK